MEKYLKAQFVISTSRKLMEIKQKQADFGGVYV
jgi:hypothetical protein